MKLLIGFMAFVFLNVLGVADDQIADTNNYEHASLPNFLPHVGKGLPGRCYLAASSNKRIASVLMVSFEEEGFEVAPFEIENKREDIFDNLSYEQILKEFPVIKRMFIDVNETADGAVVYKTQGVAEYRGEIRESSKYMIMRVYINNKLYEFCNYLKRD